MLFRSAVDEIGNRQDEEAIRQVTRCGVHILATIHGSGMEDLKNSAIGRNLLEERIFERYIVLEKAGNRQVKQTVYNKEFLKCFVC